MLLLLVLILGFVILRFGSALSQEGNPIPILISIVKLEFSNSDYEQFTTNENSYRYISENTNSYSRHNALKKLMSEDGWELKEQFGSGLVFQKDEETTVVETRLYSKYYLIWDVPKEVFD